MDCPYGAEDCPKIRELRKILEDNRQELDETKKLVIEINSTLKTVSKILGLLMTVAITMIGVIQI